MSHHSQVFCVWNAELYRQANNSCKGPFFADALLHHFINTLNYIWKMTQQCTFEKWSLAKFGCMPACQPEFSNGSATDLLHLRVLVTMVKIIFLSEKWYTCTSWKKNEMCIIGDIKVPNRCLVTKWESKHHMVGRPIYLTFSWLFF